jgi:hypothetical protein
VDLRYRPLTINVIAAIFLAKRRRAIVGFAPWGAKHRRNRGTVRRKCRPLPHRCRGFDFVIMILVESTKVLRFPGTSQLSFEVAVSRADVGLYLKTARAIRSIEWPEPTDRRSLTQQFHRAMFPALGRTDPTALLCAKPAGHQAAGRSVRRDGARRLA